MAERADSGMATTSRRDFLKAGTAAALAGGLVANLNSTVHAAGSDVLRVGLVGCGGRGTGAAAQALGADPQAKLVAMADAFRDRLEGSLQSLKNTPHKDRVEVDNDHKFVGFDAYKQVIDSCDVVLLCSPPHFRPAQLKAAVEAGKHVFAEKPVAVDAPGVRSVMESCKLAKEKNLSVVSGLCWRYHNTLRETIGKIHDGAIGDLVTLQCSYDTQGLWKHARQPSWSDMEWQVRNWLYFTWLSGDFNVEQHIHSLDKIAWVMKDEPPVKASGMGGRQTRVSPEYGHIFDHMAVTYEYANGVKLFARCRQQDGCEIDVSDHIMGTKGTCHIQSHRTSIEGENNWRYRGPNSDMYQAEHNELFASIRSGQPINNGDYMAKSTMMAIMGRMSAYTGKTVTWEQALNSNEVLGPTSYEWGSLEVPPVAMPGLTKLG